MDALKEVFSRIYWAFYLTHIEWKNNGYFFIGNFGMDKKGKIYKRKVVNKLWP